MLCSLSWSRLSKLLDLKADSSGGPNRLSEPDAVELNLMQSSEETIKKISESGGGRFSVRVPQLPARG